MSLSQSGRFGKYQIFDMLAQGGMATLWRAKITGEQGFQKLVVIKKIHQHLASEKDLIASFIDEAKLAALLQHENIVSIYDFGNMDGSYYIAMEYLFGRDLSRISAKARVKNSPISLEHALYIMARVCAGLDYAHKLKDLHGTSLNIIHRDITPQNILITYEGTVKIVDFGIAKAAGKSTLTQMGIIKGKIAYMSPEQAQGIKIDARSDIFAAGILLYEMVTGRKLFTGQDTLQVLHKASCADFVPAENIAGNLPPEVYEILHKALARDPDQRYQTDAEMQSDIEDCMARNGLRPNARGLSRYMKMLFEDDIKAEEHAVSDIAANSSQEQTISANDAPTGMLPNNVPTQAYHESREQTIPPLPPSAGMPSRSSWRRMFAYCAIGLVAMAAVAGAVLFFLKKPSLETLNNQAIELIKNEDFAQAAAAFKQILARDSSMKQAIAAPFAQALRGQALKAAKQDPKQARSLLLEAAGIDPSSAQTFFHLGVIHAKLENYPDAIAAYEKSTMLDLNYSESFFNLAYLYAMNKDYPRAEEAYSKVVTLAPSYIDEALFNLAVIQDKQGKKNECRENLQRSIIENPKNEAARGYLSKMK
jgi:serine/threonine protein kinase